MNDNIPHDRRLGKHFVNTTNAGRDTMIRHASERQQGRDVATVLSAKTRLTTNKLEQFADGLLRDAQP